MKQTTILTIGFFAMCLGILAAVSIWSATFYRQTPIYPYMHPTPMAPTATSTMTPTPTPTPQILPGRVVYTQSRLLQLVNNERVKAGVGQLTELGALDAGAMNRAQFLISTGQWSHAGINEQMKAALGYPTRGHGGEDLARYQHSDEEVIADWLASPTHRAQMLEGDYIWGGVAETGGYYVLWMSTAYGK